MEIITFDPAMAASATPNPTTVAALSILGMPVTTDRKPRWSTFTQIESQPRPIVASIGRGEVDQLDQINSNSASKPSTTEVIIAVLFFFFRL